MKTAVQTALILFSIGCLLLSPGNSKSNHPQVPEGGFVCGTRADRDRDAIARGRYRDSLLKRARTGKEAAGIVRDTYQSTSTEVGNVAILEDDGTLITPANAFNLTGRSYRFEPQSPASYRAVATNTSFDSAGGKVIRLGDDDTFQQELGFSFIFFGKSYSAVYLNSDGNLTFDQGDIAATDRDLGRFSSGSPRIGPLFTDLDPSARGSVIIRADSDGILFVWNEVSIYSDSGVSSKINSFGVKLFANGNIEFIYGGQIGADEAVVGISPGNSKDGITALHFSTDLPATNLSGTVAEVFSLLPRVSEAGIAKKFYQNHGDVFDQLTLFLNFDMSLGQGIIAYNLGIKNETKGIGLTQYNYCSEFGSLKHLGSFLNMGSLTGSNRFPDDPNQVVWGTKSTLSIMGEESGHQWLAFTPFRDGSEDSKLILGRDNAHWSFFYNSESSVMEGNRIEDRGADKGISRFRTISSSTTYSPLDQYIMGLRAKEEVPPSFLVVNPYGTTKIPSSNPALAVTFGGERKDITVDNIIVANGPRIPSILQAPKVFRQGFILLTQKGQAATSEQIKKVQNIRDAWVSFFTNQTDGRGWILTDLNDSPGTTPANILFPYFQGNSSRFTGVALANWGVTPADVYFTAYDNSGTPLSSPASIVNPRVITIAAGAQIAMLAEQIHALNLGDPRDGWIQAHSSSSQISGFFLDCDVDQNFMTGAVAGPETSKRLFFTRAHAGPTTLLSKNYKNLVSVVNPNTQAAQLTFRLLDDFGKVKGTASRTLSPYARLAQDLLVLFPSLGNANSSGYLELSADVGVVGYQSLEAGSTVFSLSAQSVSSAAKLYSAQFASGRAGGVQYFTELNLINASSEARSLQISLIGDDGFPVSGITNPAKLSMAPGSQVRSRGELLFGLPDAALSPILTEGSLVITADGQGILGDVVFGDAIGERFVASLPLEPSPTSNLVLSQVAQGYAGGTKPYFTGIAIHNPNSSDVAVTISVFSENGSSTGNATVKLPAGGRISKTLPQLVPAITEQLRGYVRIASSGGPIICFELFGDQALTFLTPVPPQPITP